MTKKLAVSDKLLDKNQKLVTDIYCAPIFICPTFIGAFQGTEEDLIFDGNFTETSLRSGTVTFVKYKKECFAITCKHVIDTLEAQESLAQKRYEALVGDGKSPEEPMVGFYTPIGNIQHHCNYKFTVVPQPEYGKEIDAAIARVDEEYIKLIGRKPIVLTKKSNIPNTGIASGFPEEQRHLDDYDSIRKFYAKFVTCTATIEETQNGEYFLNDVISEHNGVNNLSGMSGGPVLWSNFHKFGLLGIVKQGADIQPSDDGFFDTNSIYIKVEAITSELVEEWCKVLPEITKLPNRTIYALPPKTV